MKLDGYGHGLYSNRVSEEVPVMVRIPNVARDRLVTAAFRKSAPSWKADGERADRTRGPSRIFEVWVPRSYSVADHLFAGNGMAVQINPEAPSF